MKKYIIIVLFVASNYCFSQSINDYTAVIIPMKYDFQKSENQYRLQTITKMNLQKAGFKAFYATETIDSKITDRCSLLYIDVVNEGGFLTTKLYVTFKDCYGTMIFKSDIGKSREKEFEIAYQAALSNAFAVVYALNYSYNGNTNFNSKIGINAAPSLVAPTPATDALVVIPKPPDEIVPVKMPSTANNASASTLYAQPTTYGFQLIDSEPKLVMKLYKTSNPASFMAKKGDIQGVLVSKGNQWFFEYYKSDLLVSEKMDVKF